MRHDRDDLALHLTLLELVPEKPREHAPEEALRVRDRHVERERSHLGPRELAAEQDVAHLGTVPVRDDHLPRPVGPREERGELAHGLARPRELRGDRARLARAHDRVAAEGDEQGRRQGHGAS